MKKENIKELYDFINRLREKSKTVPVIVEGKRDFWILNRLGIKNIYTISGKRYTDLLEEIPENTEEVILLTDLDPQGEKIFKKLKALLEKFNLKADNSFKEELKKFGIVEVEQLRELIFGDRTKD
jgi:5S rRNA maturation endonuclease (ribonuclease M5)